jgi:hypothetical protein
MRWTLLGASTGQVSFKARTFEQRPAERLERLDSREIAKLFRSQLLDAPWTLLLVAVARRQGSGRGVVNGMTSRRTQIAIVRRRAAVGDYLARDPLSCLLKPQKRH